MIAKIRRGASFRGLADYLLSAAKGLQPGDIELRNLVAVETAVVEMLMAAGRSRKIKTPVYHVIVGWHEDERPSRGDQFEVCHALVERIGLADHQALFVHHSEPKQGATPGAGRHFETHILANRVGPNGRAAKMSNDFALVERAVAEIAAARTMKVVPGRFNGVAGLAPQGQSEAAKSFTAATGKLTLAGEILQSDDRIKALVDARVGGWPTIIAAFAAQGIALRESKRTARAGQSAGLVLTSMADVSRNEKISALDRSGQKWGRPSLEREFGPFPVDAAAEAEKHQAGKESRALPAEPPERDIPDARRKFAADREEKLDERRRLGAAHAQQKRDLRDSQKIDKNRLLEAASQRRQLITGFFGRSSVTGRSVNLLLDQRATQRLADLNAAHRTAKTILIGQHRTEIAGVSIPTWSRRVERPSESADRLPSRSPVGELKAAAQPSKQRSDMADKEAAVLATALYTEEQRAARLSENRRKKATRSRGAIDEGISQIADRLCVTVAASVIAAFRSKKGGHRLILLVLGALATGNGVAPVLLACAAIALIRRGHLSEQKMGLRADIDAAKAARSGFSVANVGSIERTLYGRLSRSDLFAKSGASTLAIARELGPARTAAFIAWWAHASPRQRNVVVAWGRPEPQRQRKDRSRGR